LPEYLDVWNRRPTYGTKDEASCCSSTNTGLFAALQQMNHVRIVSCGHDHANDFAGDYNGILLAYGRKTGFGSYGPRSQLLGARVFEFDSASRSVHTWIRQADGSVSAPPSSTTSPDPLWAARLSHWLRSGTTVHHAPAPDQSHSPSSHTPQQRRSTEPPAGACRVQAWCEYPSWVPPWLFPTAGTGRGPFPYTIPKSQKQ